MKTFNGHHNGDWKLSEDTTISGLVSGSVTVPASKHLLLSGMVTKDIVVENGASAVIHGMVNGTLINLGGAVQVYGIIDALDDRAGNCQIDANAVVKKRFK